MNRLTCATAITLIGATTAAVAADLPSRRAPPVYVAPVVAPSGYNWTGLEFGLNTSVAFPSGQTVTTTPFGGAPVAPTGITLNRAGSDDIGGGVAANYQFTPGSGFVVGVQADISYLNLKASETVLIPNGVANYQQRLAYVGTANGRIGYGFDRFLVYATGGFAYGSVHDATSFYIANPAYFGTSSRIMTGYDVGGGLEYAIPTDSILNKLSVERLLGIDKKLGLDIFDGTIRAEYVHYDLGRQTFGLGSYGGNPGGYINSERTSGNLVRVGLGYKFNGLSAPAAPVVARY